MAEYHDTMPLRPVVKSLEQVYGTPALRVTDPFEMIVLENAAYLVDDARRFETFERLRAAIGVTPEAIAEHSREEIAEAIAGGGMLPEHRAEKVLNCARLAIKAGVTEKTLRKFPSIGEPYADRILLFNGKKVTLTAVKGQATGGMKWTHEALLTAQGAPPPEGLAPGEAAPIVAAILPGDLLVRVTEQPERQIQAGGESGVGLERIGADADHDHVRPEKRIVLLTEGAHLGRAAVGEITGKERDHHCLPPVTPELIAVVHGSHAILAGPGQCKIGRAASDLRAGDHAGGGLSVSGILGPECGKACEHEGGDERENASMHERRPSVRKVSQCAMTRRRTPAMSWVPPTPV